MSTSSIILIVLILGLAVTKTQLGISDDIFSQVMGFLVGVLSQKGASKVVRIRKAKKEAAQVAP